MKKTNRSSHDELNLTNYSAMKNILYCLNNTVKCHSPLLCLCSLKILIGTLIPILTTILPKIVIEMITAKQSVYKLASAILSFMGSLAILSGADKFLTKLIYHQKFRMNTFYLKHAALKGLTISTKKMEFFGSFKQKVLSAVTEITLRFPIYMKF